MCVCVYMWMCVEVMTVTLLSDIPSSPAGQYSCG